MTTKASNDPETIFVGRWQKYNDRCSKILYLFNTPEELERDAPDREPHITTEPLLNVHSYSSSHDRKTRTSSFLS